MKSRYAVCALLLAGIFSAMCLLLPSPSSAYCVYNHTNTDFDVCGESCNRCFRKYIDSGEHGCCPGGHKGCRGETYITIRPIDFSGVSIYHWYAPIQVTSHGWVSIHGKCKEDIQQKDACDDLRVVVNNDHGHVIYDGKLYRLGLLKWSHCRDD